MVDAVEDQVDEDEEVLDDVGDEATPIAHDLATAFQGAIAQPESGNRFFKVGSLDLSKTTQAEAIADLTRFIEGSEPDVIGLQNAGGLPGLLGAFPGWLFIAPDETVVVDDGGPDDDIPGVDNVPVMVRRSTCIVKSSGAFVGGDGKVVDDGETDALVFPVVWARIVHRQTRQNIRIYNTLAPSPFEAEIYAQHTRRIARHVQETSKKIKVVVIGGWDVDYRSRDEKVPGAPMMALGKASLKPNWAYGSDTLPISGLKFIGSEVLPDHIYHRVHAEMKPSSDRLIATTYTDHYGLSVLYDLDVRKVVEPVDDDPDTDQPVKGRGLITFGSLVLSQSGTLAEARTDFETFDDAVGGLDIVGLQGTSPSNREDLLDGTKPFSLVRFDSSRGQARTAIAYRRSRFKRISADAVKISDKAYRRPGNRTSLPQWATEVVLLDRKTNRRLTVWSVWLPPSSDGQGSPTSGTNRHQIMRDCLAAATAKSRDLPKTDAFVLLGNLNWPAERKQSKQSAPAMLTRGDLISTYAVLGTTPDTYKGSAMDYAVISERGWATWQSHGAVNVPKAIHNGFTADLRVKPLPRPAKSQGGRVDDDGPPETGSFTSADYIFAVASANLRYTLSPAQVGAGGQAVAAVADVIGFQEIDDPGAQDGLHAALPGYTFHYTTGEAGAVTIGVRDSKFQLAPLSAMPDGIERKASFFMHAGLNGAGPGRWVNYVALVPTNNTSAKPFIVANTHYVSKAWNRRIDDREEWRRSNWNLHYQKHRDIMARLTSAGLTVIWTGDTNRRPMPRFPRFRLVHVESVDYIFLAEPNRGVQMKTLKTGRINTPSDHDAIWARFRARS